MDRNAKIITKQNYKKKILRMVGILKKKRLLQKREKKVTKQKRKMGKTN